MKKLISGILIATFLNAGGDIVPPTSKGNDAKPITVAYTTYERGLVTGAIAGAVVTKNNKKTQDIEPVVVPEPVIVPTPIGLKYNVKGISKTGTLNIRTGTSSKHKKVGELAYNASKIIINKCEYNDEYEEWCKLGTPFSGGWVSKEYIEELSSYLAKYEFMEVEGKFYNVKFKVIQSTEDELVKVQSGRGLQYTTVDTLDETIDNIIVSSCQKNKKDEEWCWINYGEQKYGWIAKESITPKIDSCSVALRFANDENIMKELCQKDAEKFEKEGRYTGAVYYYLFAEKLDKIIEIYTSKKFINNKDTYKIIAYAYKKSGDNKTYETIMNNHNKWNYDIGWGDDKNKTKLYLKWYPSETEIIFPKSKYLDYEEGDIAPVVVPVPSLSVEEKQKIITPCLEIAQKEKLTLDELYQGCYQSLEKLRWADISDLEDRYKLVTIAMILDEVKPEAMMFNRYLKKIKSKLLSKIYTVAYKYIRNDVKKEQSFKETLYNILFYSSYYDDTNLDQQTLMNALHFLQSLGKNISSANELVKTFSSKYNEIKSIEQEMSHIAVCLMTAYKKKDKKPFFKTLNPIYYNSNTHKIEVSNLIEYYVLPLIVQYISEYHFSRHYNEAKDNLEHVSSSELIENIEGKFQDSKDKKEAFFFSLFDRKEIEKSLYKYLQLIKDNNATSVYNHYLNTKLQPLIVNNEALMVQDDDVTVDILSNNMIKAMILGCRTQSENKYSQINCIDDFINDAIKPMKDIYQLDDEILATIWFAKEDYLKANYYIKELLDEKEYDAKSIELAQHYQQLAVGYYKLNKFAKSLKYLKKSLGIFKSYSKSIKYCNTLKLLPLLQKNIKIDKSYLNEQQAQMAQCKIYNSLSNEEYAKVETQILSATFMNIINSPCLDIKSLLEGEVPKELTTDGIEASIKMNGKYSLITSKLYRQKASSLFKDKKYNEAYQSIQESFKIILYIRDVKFPYMTYLQKIDFLDEVKKYIALYLNISFQKGKDSNEISKETITNWIKYKGSVLDSENAIATLYDNTEDEALKQEIKKLIDTQRTLAKLYQTLPKDNDYQRWQEQIKNTEADILKLTNSIADKAESFKEQEGLKSISYKDISANLKENELYIDYAKGGEFYYIFTSDKDNKVTFYQIEKEKSQKIEQLITGYREDIQKIIESKGSLSNIDSQDKLSKLYKLLIKEPLNKKLKQYSNLIISPDGALRLLPFEALYDDKAQKYLIESKEIRYIPSGKELIRLYRYASKNSNQTPKATIISNPNFDSKKFTKIVSNTDSDVTLNYNQGGIVKSLFKFNFEPLIGTKLEAQNIINLLQPSTMITHYQEDNASESNLMEVSSPNILHIATHGFFINDANVPNPMLKSGIALSGANESAKSKQGEGIVTALKLSGLKLKGTDLVVLSACKTGVVDTKDTDSISGLGKAFIQAGAKDIVMSLWSVDDNATQELMTSFYQKMQTNSNYSKALKEAKLEMIANNKHPFFWAGFVLSGL